MEVNWTILAYIIIGLFALSGFFKGWWKEAVTTWFLAFLVFLLYFPPLAQLVINVINFIFATIARLLPDTLRATVQNFLEATLGITTVDGAIQLDASNGGTWLVILLLFIGLALFVSRFSLPSDFRLGLQTVYRPTLWASLLGAVIGALNGFIIISLINAYLNGTNLPGLTAAARQAAPRAERTLEAVAVPSFVITESFLPWILIGIGLVVFIVALTNRVVITRDRQGFVKVDYRKPLGYEQRDVSVPGPD